jgi:hypothetical protein
MEKKWKYVWEGKGGRIKSGKDSRRRNIVTRACLKKERMQEGRRERSTLLWYDIKRNYEKHVESSQQR